MNKAQLVEQVSKTTALTKTDVETVLNNTFEFIKKSVKKGDDVTLVGFGTFTKSKRKARAGRKRCNRFHGSTLAGPTRRL